MSLQVWVVMGVAVVILVLAAAQRKRDKRKDTHARSGDGGPAYLGDGRRRDADDSWSSDGGGDGGGD